MRTLRSLVAASLLLGLPAALVAQEASIQACVGRSGKLRVVDAATSCGKKETPLGWAVAGPPGPQGPEGPPGPATASCVTVAKLTVSNLPGAGADGTIGVVAYSFALTYEPPPLGGTGSAQFADLVVLKRIDAASPAIFRSAIEGDLHDTARLEVFGADGVTPVLTYDLSAVVITSVQHASSGCDAAPTESIALRFAEKVTLATP